MAAPARTAVGRTGRHLPTGLARLPRQTAMRALTAIPGIVPGVVSRKLAANRLSTVSPAGSALPEIGQVLRHRSQLSTAAYAKIDRSRLGELARPWPGGSR